MKYLFIFEDGELRRSDKEVTQDDIDAVADGILDILDIENDLQMFPNGTWQKIETFD